MATRVHEYTIPTSFQALDDNTTAADSFVDVYSMQTARKNHNILLARGIRRPLYHWTNTGSGNSPATLRPPTRDRGFHVLDVPLIITPGTKELEFVARLGNVTASVELYPVLDGPGESKPIDTSIKITVSGTARYAATVPVPWSLQQNGGQGRFSLIKTGVMGGASESTKAILDSGPDWVDIDNLASDPETNAVYFSNTDIEPKIIVRTINLGAGSASGNKYRCWADSIWNIEPDPNADTASTETPGTLTVSAICIYEKAVTDFAGFVDFADQE